MRKILKKLWVFLIIALLALTAHVSSTFADEHTKKDALPAGATPTVFETSSAPKGESGLKCEGDEKGLGKAAEESLAKQQADRVQAAADYSKKLTAFNEELKKKEAAERNAQAELDGIKARGLKEDSSEFINKKRALDESRTATENFRSVDNAVASLEKSIIEQEVSLRFDPKRVGDDSKEKKLAEDRSKLEELSKYSTQKEKENLKKLENTPEYKQAQNYKKYKELITANNEKLKEIAATPLDKSGKLVALKQDANKKYCQYLKAQYAADDCEISAASEADPTKKAEARKRCQKFIDQAKAEGKAVRDVINQLTKDEQILNQEAEFNVSNLFSVKKREKNEKNLSLTDVTNKVADWMILLVGSLAVTALIIGGFMMVISGGDETRLETGKTIFTYSLIGVTITLLAYGIITFIQSLFYT